MEFLERIRDYIRISRVALISRRLFVINAFDGAMTFLGILVGAYVASGEPDPSLIISAGLGASFAMGLSGFAGAYVTEEAERIRQLDQLEQSMLKNLDRSMIGRASRFASLWVGIINGMSPALTAVLCLVPFFISYLFPAQLPMISAIRLSVAITLVILFMLGVFLGKISDRNLFLHGMKLLCVGVVLTVVLLVFKSI